MDTSNNPDSSTKMINKISFQKKRINENKECIRCGRSGHSNESRDCPAKNAKCRKCNLQGHFAICCKTKMKRGTETTGTKGKYKRPKTEVNFIDQSNLETEERDVEGDGDNWECF